MDNETARLLAGLAESITSLGLALYMAYRAESYVKALAVELKEITVRYMAHLEKYHSPIAPSSPDSPE